MGERGGVKTSNQVDVEQTSDWLSMAMKTKMSSTSFLLAWIATSDEI